MFTTYRVPPEDSDNSPPRTAQGSETEETALFEDAVSPREAPERLLASILDLEKPFILVAYFSGFATGAPMTGYHPDALLNPREEGVVGHYLGSSRMAYVPAGSEYNRLYRPQIDNTFPTQAHLSDSQVRWQEAIAEYALQIELPKPTTHTESAIRQESDQEAGVELQLTSYHMIGFDFKEQIRIALREDPVFGDEWHFLKEGGENEDSVRIIEGLPMQNNRVLTPVNKEFNSGSC
ncbi:hypothetical protein BZG36_05681 [Bifiguratus adelaidae]|uniref:Uncharacterized protein n=1 Tax=Bifiguratus adelaidae TaxID=1938954 RepID=A0A261XSY9_9FUNG|nr:hypothetical protein BZG36_05681 [Bifiguratus adelaidae]